MAQPYELDTTSLPAPSRRERLAHVTTKAAVWALGPAAPFVVVAAIAVGYAALYAFVCDDAYISFRYALNFAQGRGLVFNDAEYVEGYTNFLWVVELAVLHKLTGVSFPALSLVLSGLATIGTFGLTGLLAWRGPIVARRYLAALLAVGWLAINRNVAVWTTSGLETRQFTFFILLAVWCLSRAAQRQRAHRHASLALAAAALTRPEGALIFAGVLLWYALDCRLHQRFCWRNTLALIVPFVALVGAHALFRRFYYHDWLPNTYYAKAVRSWPDAGLTYLTAVTVESGLYLAAPLALLGGLWRWLRRRDTQHLLSACLIVPHALYLVTLGGDHFEFRPLDFYWPLLAIACAEGLVVLTVAVQLAARRRRVSHSRQLATATALSGAAVCAAYGSVVQLGEYALTYEQPFYAEHVNAELTPDTFPLAYLLPFADRLVPLYNGAMKSLLPRAVAVRWREHERFSYNQRASFGAYGKPRRALPPGAIVAYPCVGILPFAFPEVTVIDTLGLTDRTVARNPVLVPNALRRMAHDRQPPAGYLESRGVNLHILPAVEDRQRALASAQYAVELSDGVWMPFDSSQADWVSRAFHDLGLNQRLQWSNTVEDSHAMLNGRLLRGRRVIADFDRAAQGWQLAGFAVQQRAVAGQAPIGGQVGGGWLSSFSSSQKDTTTGKASSPVFEITPHDVLALGVGGGSSEQVGVELVVEGRSVATFRGSNSEILQPVFLDLNAYAGRQGQVVAFDESSDAWGHILLDQVVLLH